MGALDFGAVEGLLFASSSQNKSSSDGGRADARATCPWCAKNQEWANAGRKALARNRSPLAS